MLTFLFIELSWTALCKSEENLLEFHIDLRSEKDRRWNVVNCSSQDKVHQRVDWESKFSTRCRGVATTEIKNHLVHPIPPTRCFETQNDHSQKQEDLDARVGTLWHRIAGVLQHHWNMSKVWSSRAIEWRILKIQDPSDAPKSSGSSHIQCCPRTGGDWRVLVMSMVWCCSLAAVIMFILDWWCQILTALPTYYRLTHSWWLADKTKITSIPSLHPGHVTNPHSQGEHKICWQEQHLPTLCQGFVRLSWSKEGGGRKSPSE